MPFDCAYRYRFYPTEERAVLLSRTFGCVRFVYNRAREMGETARVERKERCGFIQTNAMLTKLKTEPEFEWLREVSCVPLQQSLRHPDAASGKILKKQARYPRFRRKDARQSAEFTKSGFNFRDGVLRLAKMTEPLNVVWSRPLETLPSTVTIIREADGRWYVSCHTARDLKPLPANDNAVGANSGRS